MFSARALSQTADLSGATDVTVSDVETVTVSEAGVYVLRGCAGNTCVIVATGDDDDVQLVLDGLQSSRRISHAFRSRTPTQTASTPTATS